LRLFPIVTSVVMRLVLMCWAIDLRRFALLSIALVLLLLSSNYANTAPTAVGTVDEWLMPSRFPMGPGQPPVEIGAKSIVGGPSALCPCASGHDGVPRDWEVVITIHGLRDKDGSGNRLERRLIAEPGKTTALWDGKLYRIYGNGVWGNPASKVLEVYGPAYYLDKPLYSVEIDVRAPYTDVFPGYPPFQYDPQYMWERNDWCDDGVARGYYRTSSNQLGGGDFYRPHYALDPLSRWIKGGNHNTQDDDIGRTFNSKLDLFTGQFIQNEMFVVPGKGMEVSWNPLDDLDELDIESARWKYSLMHKDTDGSRVDAKFWYDHEPYCSTGIQNQIQANSRAKATVDSQHIHINAANGGSLVFTKRNFNPRYAEDALPRGCSDRNGNQIELERLEHSWRIIDTLNDTLTYTYGEIQNVLTHVPTGKQLIMEYHDDLWPFNVTYFKLPDGRAFSIYHNLEGKITNFKRILNDVEQPWITNVYEAVPGGDPYRARIIQQTVGGTTYLINYEQLPSSSWIDPVLRTTVTDGRGYKLIVDFDWWGRPVRRSDSGFVTSFQWTNPEDPKFVNTHLLKSIKYPTGKTITYSYAGEQNPLLNSSFKWQEIVGIVESPGAAGGEMLSHGFEYNTPFSSMSGGFDFLSAYVDPKGNRSEWKYDTRGNMVNATIGGIATHDFEYEVNGGRLLSHTFPESDGKRRKDEIAYFAQGSGKEAFVEKISEAGATTTYGRNPKGEITSIKDSRGNETLVVPDGFGRVISIMYPGGTNRIESFTYYPGTLNVDVATTPDYEAKFTYDLVDNVDTIRFTKGTETAFLDYDYDANFNLILEKFENQQTKYDYDPRNLLERVTRNNAYCVEYQRNPNGVIKRVRSGKPGFGSGGTPGGQTLTTTYELDGHDQVIAVTDPLGLRRSFERDRNGNIIASATGIGASSTNFTAVYDSLNRVTSTISQGADAAESAAFDYWPASQLKWIRDGRNNTTTYSYGEKGLLESVERPGGDTTAVTYNANNDIETITETVEENQLTSELGYDELNRVNSVKNPENKTFSVARDLEGKITSTSDWRGNTTQNTFNLLGLLETCARRLQGGATPIDVTTEQEHDPQGLLTAKVDPENQATVYSDHDPMGRPQKIKYADGNEVEVQYDLRGNPTYVKDPNGTVIRSTHDIGRKQVTRTITPGAGVGGGSRSELFKYDEHGRLLSAKNDNSLVTYTYDALGRVKSETLDGKTTSYTYDANGDLETCTYPSARQLTFSRDGQSRIEHIRDAAATPLVSYTYASRDRVKTRTARNGVVLEYDYDAAGRIERSQHARPMGEGQSPYMVDDRTYGYDDAGNLEELVEQLPGGGTRTRSFTHDALNRLKTSQTGTETITYQVDDVHARKAVSGGPDAGEYSSVGAPPNAYSTTPFDSRTYDNNGNLKSVTRNGEPASKRSFEYNHANQLVTCRSGAGTVRYEYDALGRLISRTAQSGLGAAASTTRYYYAGWRVIEERTDGDVVAATYVHGNGIDELVSVQTGGCDDLFTHGDRLGNITALTNAQGAVVERYSYDDYGQVQAMTASGAPLAGASCAYLFNGRRWDPVAQLYEYRTRWYDPRAGCFTTRDSIGDWGDPGNLGNGYAYVGNGPLNATDPFGMQTPSDSAIINWYRFGDSPFTTIGEAAGAVYDGLWTEPWQIVGDFNRAKGVQLFGWLGRNRTKGATSSNLSGQDLRGIGYSSTDNTVKYGNQLGNLATKAQQNLLLSATGPVARFKRGMGAADDVLEKGQKFSPLVIHNRFVTKVRPGAKERVFQTPWSSSSGLGTRRFDDFDDINGIAFEGNTTPWSRMTDEQLSRKLDQVGADFALLRANSEIKRIVWFGTEELPTTGLGARLRDALKSSGIDYWVITE